MAEESYDLADVVVVHGLAERSILRGQGGSIVVRHDGYHGVTSSWCGVEGGGGRLTNFWEPLRDTGQPVDGSAALSSQVMLDSASWLPP